ncbi:hypothetical protein JMJ56_29465 [Belnapia sp. T18]|uniref:Uncharacterized protein n=1 Tax=Belnapia arida TaxID=2804533 RepID=A0ABS1UC49_9PROT|nr:hypothetical protein [Belnapia arida]MBL6082110.1 hypothetical protein [Belnapia arida]
MSDKTDRSGFNNDGYVPLQKGYTVIPSGTKVEGGYRPTTSEGPSSAPASVPNQPSSVQPPKK